tara:strand:+ start:1227 stop:1421 length:195 start_codon:yes stop_codon:yes gene_type:complete
MSKDKQVEVKPTGKTEKEIEEVIQNLRVQFKDHNEKATFHSNMAIKAQGAIEVLSQMLPDESKD